MDGAGGSTGLIPPFAVAESQYVNAKISVWWDIENCEVPDNCEPHEIAQNISSALVKMNYCGPVSISAYGDTNSIKSSVQQALNSTGIALNHVPAGVKDASDKKILVDMLFWAVDNPAPANYLLISGDRDFSNALHQLRMRRYNILLAQHEVASAPLLAAARSVWLWTSLLAGGPPVTKEELESLKRSPPPVLDNNKSNFIFSSNTTQTPVTESTPTKPAVKFSIRKPTDSKGKQTKKTLSQENLLRTSSAPAIGIQENQNVANSHQPNQNAVTHQPGYSYPVQFTNSQAFSSTYNSSFPVSEPTPNFVSGTHDSWTSSNNIQSSQPQQVRPNNTYMQSPPMFAPGDSHWTSSNNRRPSQPQQARPNNTYMQSPPMCPPPNSFVPPNFQNRPQNFIPPFTAGPVTSLPDISNINLSEYNPPTSQPKKVNNSKYNHVNESSNRVKTKGPPKRHFVHSANQSTPLGGSEIPPNGIWGTPGCPAPSEYVQGLIGVVLLALNTLKNEKIMPTESNIADCIRCGDPNQRNTDVKKAIGSAVEQQLVVKQSLNNLQFYVGKNEKLWSCVNPISGNLKHYPQNIWDQLQQFLTSSDGRTAILSSECRYEAASIIRNMCLKDYSLGNILQILHIAIKVKKWIAHNNSGWQPIKITLPDPNPDSGWHM